MTNVYEIVIEPKDTAPTHKRRGPAPKTREFSAYPLVHVCADHLWSGGASNKETVRPVFLQLANSELALRPVVTNLRLGQRAALYYHNPDMSYRGSPRGYFETLRSGEYTNSYLKMTEGKAPNAPVKLVSTLYQPKLFRQNAGALSDARNILFCTMAPRWWVAQEEAATEPTRLAAIEAHFAALGGFQPQGEKAPWPVAWLHEVTPWAIYVLAYLESRTPRPFVPTEAFYLQVFLAALEAKILTMAWDVECGERQTKEWRVLGPESGDRWWWARSKDQMGFTAWGVAQAGCLPPVACATTPDILDPFLAQQVERYFTAQQRIDTKAAPVPSEATRRKAAVLALVNGGALAGGAH